MKIMKRLIQAIILVALCTSGVAAQSAGTTPSDKVKLTLTTGVDYSSGDYGQVIDTHILYMPVITKIRYDRWTAKLTIPYLSITGPGVVIGGEDGSDSGTPGAKTTESGLGDVTASLGYTFPIIDDHTKLSLTGKIKFPTADEDRNLGTGQFDYTAQAGINHNIGDAFVSASVARKFNGSSARFMLNDVWKYSVGAGYSFTKNTTAGLTYDFREAAGTGDNISEASAYLAYKVAQDWTVQIYAMSGFTDASPDLGGGLQLSYQFEPFAFLEE